MRAAPLLCGVMMTTVQFEGDNVRYFGNDRVRVFTGSGLTRPVIFPGCAAPAPAGPSYGPTPYYSLTPLRLGAGGEPDRPAFASGHEIPGLTLSPVNMTLREPVSGDPDTWETPRWRHFVEDGAPLPGVPEFTRADLLPPGAGIWLELDHLVPVTSGPPVNSALVGLVNPTLQAHLALGLLGTGVTGALAQIGYHLRLMDETMSLVPPVHQGTGLTTSERRIAVRVTPYNVSGQARAQITLFMLGRTDPMVPIEIQEVGTQSGVLWADMLRFLSHYDTRPGVAIVAASMAPMAAPSATSVCRHLRIAV